MTALVQLQDVIPPRLGVLEGSAPATRQAVLALQRAAQADATLLLLGETGTGKTRAAELVHAWSHRANRPFLVLDCGATPANLLEAELFGHERGAFTGASARRVGIFEEAEGGTVFLDEIGELPLDLQTRLLRVLDERRVKRIGQNHHTPVDVRVIAATHRDLSEAVRAGRFRADLYFRLAVFPVRLPSLSERAGDVPTLVNALLESLGATPRSHAHLFDVAFRQGLSTRCWPGNVRELRNFLERAMHGVPSEEAPQQVVPLHAFGSLAEGRARAIEAFERQYLRELMARHEGRVRNAAIEAGVDRVYIYRLLRKYRDALS
ncbi:MAG: sigma-54 dependent transcriptional regulator [Archangium sp.]